MSQNSPAQDNSWCPCLSLCTRYTFLLSVACPVRRRRVVRYSRGLIVSPANGKGRACHHCPAWLLELARRSVLFCIWKLFSDAFINSHWQFLLWIVIREVIELGLRWVAIQDCHNAVLLLYYIYDSTILNYSWVVVDSMNQFRYRTPI
jgi:hypothetical protein